MVKDVQQLLHEVRYRKAALKEDSIRVTRVQQQAERLRERSLDIEDMAEVPYIVVSSDDKVCGANRSASGILGLEPKRLLGKRFMPHFVAAGWQPVFESLRANAERTGKAVTSELMMRRANTTKFLVQVEAHMGDDAVLELSILRMSWREPAARKPEQSPELILQSIPDGVLAVDSSWRIGYANDAAATMLKKPREQLVGHTIWHTFPAPVRTRLRAELKRVQQEHATISFEQFFPGSLARWYQFRCFPAAGGVCILITDSKS